ncbi:hypothetical protein [Flavobacterium piscis]|uniref:Nuclear transport factor 2 (NTF2) superfamily protein n=1 Tax=Flavobacterium piscis TaxID=1114874 RepID=A0ABU1YB66_9FLAO|nr:hypothetical protein [Flavobacterium piscis]MDR7211487.1 nuclear transport factor 2 (NTF2) superfamily protein [Flavobacterium piscis]
MEKVQFLDGNKINKNKMKNLFLILSLIFTIVSCNSKKNNPNLKDIQEIFKVKGNVKEIKRDIWSKTTMKDLYLSIITTFDTNGNPIETIDYDKEGKIKNRTPWKRQIDEEIKDSEHYNKKEYDNKKRLIKEYENNIEILYKYNEKGQKSEEIRSFGNKTIQTIYDSNGLLKERMHFVSSDYDSFWQSKEKFIYNKKNQLIQTLIYRYSDENQISAKYLYEYDEIGSLVKSTFYVGKEIIEIENRKIIYY